MCVDGGGARERKGVYGRWWGCACMRVGCEGKRGGVREHWEVEGKCLGLGCSGEGVGYRCEGEDRVQSVSLGEDVAAVQNTVFHCSFNILFFM